MTTQSWYQSVLDLGEFTYTPCYCEENAYLLAKRLRDYTSLEVNVVFISNEAKTVPFWCCKHGKDADGFVIWDYHVFVVAKSPDFRWWILDLDSTNGMPCIFSQYVDSTFHPENHLRENFLPKFKVVDCDVFLNTFASDRRHMRSESGEWLAKPPSYAPIQGKNANLSNTVHNLDRFIDVNDSGNGSVFDLDSFILNYVLL